MTSLAQPLEAGQMEGRAESGPLVGGNWPNPGGGPGTTRAP